MLFRDKATQLEAEGYTHYYDRERQYNAEKCSRCGKKYSVESFAKNGEYKHYAVCIYCDGWICLTDDSEYFYPASNSTARSRNQDQIDSERLAHYVHGLRLSTGYEDFKCFILAYTVCEIKAKGGKRPEGLKPADIRKVATEPTEANVDKFFRRFYRSKPAPRDRQRWSTDLIKAAKRDLGTLDFLESQGIADLEKWFDDIKYPEIIMPTKEPEHEQLSLFAEVAQ